MSATEINELRNGAKKYLDHADERVVRMVYAMLETDAEIEQALCLLTPEQETILDECIELDEKGLLEYSSWEEVRAGIISKK